MLTAPTLIRDELDQAAPRLIFSTIDDATAIAYEFRINCGPGVTVADVRARMREEIERIDARLVLRAAFTDPAPIDLTPTKEEVARAALRAFSAKLSEIEALKRQVDAGVAADDDPALAKAIADARTLREQSSSIDAIAAAIVE